MAKRMEILYVRALIPVLTRLKLSTSDILQGPLVYTTLPWQVPPLISDEKLGKVPLQELLDCEATVKEEALYALWHDGMLDLMNNPKKVVGAYGYRSLYTALDAPHGERAMRFSKPEGYPDEISEYAGAVFSLEAAHACKVSGLAAEVHQNDCDYWVKTPAGYEIGIRNGVPIVGGDQWDTSLNGIMPEMLRRPRGDVHVGCDYDLISRLRSFLYQYRDRVADVFEAADWLLQGLRVVAYGKHLPHLLSAIQNLGELEVGNRTKLEDLKDCVEVLLAPGLSDRQKFSTVKGLLVPHHYGKTAFSREVYPYNAEVPAVFGKRQMERLRGNVEALYRIEEARHAN